MSNKRYPDEFKIEAVKHVTERGHSVAEVASRLGVSQHSLYQWIKLKSQPADVQQRQQAQTEEMRRLKAELKRVTEERDILKRPQRTLPSNPGEVRVHQTGRGQSQRENTVPSGVGTLRARRAGGPAKRGKSARCVRRQLRFGYGQ